jgi:hypothetical protein
MIAQVVLTLLLGGLLLYAVKEARKSPAVGAMTVVAAMAGLYVVWLPHHASIVAEWAGIGRGADLILYVWAALSLIIMLNLHLKVRGQLELMTGLARAVALLTARHATMASRLDKPSTPGSRKIRERATPPPSHRPKRPRSTVQRRTHSR